MKKDKLYTYGKKGNIFWPGGELNSYGWVPKQMTAINSYPVANTAANYGLGTYQAPTFQTATISSIQPQIAAMKPVSAPTTSTKSGSIDWGGIAGTAAAAAPREAFDILDPVYHLAAGRETKVGNALSDTGVGLFKAGASSGNAGLMIAGAAAKIGGGLINAGWGIKENKKNTAAIKENTALAKSVGNELGSANTNNEVLNAADNMANSLGFKASDLYKNGWFTKKGTKKGNALRNQEAGALAYQNHALTTGAENADYNMDSNIMRNFAAFGGPIDSMGFIEDMPATSYGFMKDYLTQREKQIDSKNKLSGISPTNAFCGGGRMFHGGGCLPMMFDFGGNMGTNSSDFPTGLTHIDAGGSHEENKYQGVQVGVDAEGTPNLVEEGETIYNDYVFSNRIELDDEAKKAFHIGKKRDITYAEMSKKLEKEASERPNDPISKAALKAQLQELSEHQERQKQEMEAERAREAFEALSPEEQTAVMQQVAQQEQAAQEQAVQEEVMAQQQAQGQQMQMSPEEAAMMQQQQMQGQPMMGQPEVVEGQPAMACGGKINRFDGGGKLREKIYNALGIHTDREFIDWVNRNKIIDNGKWAPNSTQLKSMGEDDDEWMKLIQDPVFVTALSESNPALADVISRGYDFGAYTPEQLAKATIQSISRGNWKATNGKGWNGSEDLAFKQATKGMTDAEINVLSTERLAQLMRNTDAFKNTSKWLENSDNALLYLNTLLGDKDTPEVAKEYARKFVQDGKWKDGFTYDYGTVFGKDGKGVRETNPGTYWHSVMEANRDNLVKNLVYDRDKDTWEDIIGDIPADWRLSNTYAWNDPTSQYTYNYYMRPGREFHRVEGHTDYLDGTPDTWRGVGKETRRETLPNGDTIIYHAAGDGTDANGNRKIVPVLKDEWPRYTGLFGPAAGLLMQGFGFGRPDTNGLQAVLTGYDKTGVSNADYKPIGNYLRYVPMDVWAAQNRMDANTRASERILMNTTSPSKWVNVIANNYASQLGNGELHKQSLEYNDTNALKKGEFNRGTDMFNAQAYNQTSQFNASQRERDRQLRAQLGMQAAAQKADMDAAWYNGIYGNVAGLFKGISDIGRENAERNMLARLAASGALGTIDPEGVMNADLIKYANSAAEGGKTKRKKNKRRGLTI